MGFPHDDHVGGASTTTSAQALAGKKPNRIISVPREYRRDTLFAERNILVNDIKTEFKCDVTYDKDQAQIRKFQLYGSGQNLEAATRFLNNWIYRAGQKSKYSSTWAKTSAFNWNDWYDSKVSELEDARRQKFKESAPEFGEDGKKLLLTQVDWPQDLLNVGVVPRDVFGNKAELLDRLRVQDQVYITLLEIKRDKSDIKKRNDPPVDYEDYDEDIATDEKVEMNDWKFVIYAHTVLHAQTAQAHLETLIDKVRLDHIGEQEVSLNMILDAKEGIDVRLQRCEPWWPNKVDQIVPRLEPSGMMEDPGSFQEDGLHFTQLSSIRHAIGRAHEKVRHRKGSYNFVIRLGGLALSARHVPIERIGQTFAKNKFIKEISAKVELRVKKWLIDDELGCDILLRMMDKELAGYLLEPIKPTNFYGIIPHSLEATRPKFQGNWVFQDPNTNPKAAVNALVIQIEWTQDEDGLYEKGQPTFHRLEPGQLGMRKNMDVNLLELGESRGWEYALDSMTAIPRDAVATVLVGFADQVRMKRGYEIWSKESFATWAETPTVKRCLLTSRQDMIYSFGIRNTCYKVELSSMWYPNQKQPVWGLGIRHVQWEAHLALLESLALGERAEWGNTMDAFFPKDGLYYNPNDDEDEDLSIDRLDINGADGGLPRDGLSLFMEKLMQISELVSSVTRRGGGVAI